MPDMRFLIILLVFPFASKAQINAINWGVEDTSFCIVKSTDFIIVHDYLELYNYAGTDLDMQWVIQVAPDWPIQWEAGFTDPDSVYTDVLVEDTGSFVLPYPVAFSNKLILDVDHNGHIDSSYLRFKVYPVNFPDDTLWLNYCVIITAPDVSLDEADETGVSIWYNPITQVIQFANLSQSENLVAVYAANGDVVVYAVMDSGETEFPIKGLAPGVYVVMLDDGVKTHYQKITVN